MSDPIKELEKDIRTGLDHLTQLRDEIRVKLHLAGMDAKDAWTKLEPKVQEAEHLAHDVSETTKHAVEDVVERVRAFRRTLS